MATSLYVAYHGFVGAPAMRPVQPTSAAVRMDAIADLKSLAKEQNPVVGYWDPLNLAYLNFWGKGDDATVGFLRHAEIKHGRAAMAAFVGYCVQSAGITFPWTPYAGYVPADIAPPAQWDAMPDIAKFQIIATIGFLEVYSVHSFILEKYGQKHYMKGGKPGFFPPLETMVHPCPFNLYDPFKLFGGMSEAKKQERLLMEVNNGRLAMIGIFGFISEAKIPGAVPGLSFIKHYDGDVMQPFSDGWSLWS